MRCIVIEHCRGCPHWDHKGAFGTVAYLPYCKLVGKDLPHTVAMTGFTARLCATTSPDIPEWCPLPVFNAKEGAS